LLDVHQHNEHALDLARGIAQGEVVRAHPPARIRSLERAAVEDFHLPVQRALHVAAAVVPRRALEHLVGGSALELVGRAPGVDAVRGIHVVIAQIPVEHARRQDEDVHGRGQRRDPRGESSADRCIGDAHGVFSPAVTVNCQSVRLPDPTV
jgi:hypothetical protein